jgi:predicted phosphodiesterase
MRYAVLSDIHGQLEKLQGVLADARSRGAEQILCLGDVVGDDCVTLIHQAGALAVLGNFEVSGWRQLATENREWVQSWPSLLAGATFLAAHAAPWQPEGLLTVEQLAAWLQKTGQHWRAIFPNLDEDEDYLWQALAELETAAKMVLFHGHTHVQRAWRCGPAGRLQRIGSAAINVKADHHYLVGVGSVGLPKDGAWSAYALYDEDKGRIELVRLTQP